MKRSNQVTPNSCASRHMDQITPYIPHTILPLPARLRITPGYDIVNPHNRLNKRMYVWVQIPPLPPSTRKGRKRKEKVYESLRPAITEFKSSVDSKDQHPRNPYRNRKKLQICTALAPTVW
ncbi:hypothetical protein BDW42DRAFT_74170 [Aspergillus taichungensis]|uniref:Uncharacterized protein n=1 Tax=Aspergillus taichungensis TaxID=482145 RepID=A0A2J5HZ35_9EURO|nr:hypothetical protein BDW42DRAFT_74170 [Aspergillus taichungensis]